MLDGFIEKFEGMYNSVDSRINHWSEILNELSLKYEARDQQQYIKMLENELQQKDKLLAQAKRLQADYISEFKTSSLKETLNGIYDHVLADNQGLVDKVKALEMLLLEKKMVERREFDALKAELKDMKHAFSEKNESNMCFKVKTEISLLKNRLMKLRSPVDSERLEASCDMLGYIKLEIDKIDRLFTKTAVKSKLKAVEKISREADNAMVLKNHEQAQKNIITELKGLVNDLSLVLKRNSQIFDSKEKLVQYSVDADLRLVQKDVARVLERIDGIAKDKDKVIEMLERKFKAEVEAKDKYMLDKHTDVFYLLNGIHKTLQDAKQAVDIEPAQADGIIQQAGRDLSRLLRKQEEVVNIVNTMNSNATALRLHQITDSLEHLQKSREAVDASVIVKLLEELKSFLK